jgi:hypothetical protein
MEVTLWLTRTKNWVDLRSTYNSRSATRVKVNMHRGRIVEAEVKAVVEKTNGVRLQISFGNETALVYLWQVVAKL